MRVCECASMRVSVFVVMPRALRGNIMCSKFLACLAKSTILVARYADVIIVCPRRGLCALHRKADRKEEFNGNLQE